MATQTLLTLDQFYSLPEDPKVRRELLDGRLIELFRPQPEHAFVAGQIAYLLGDRISSAGLEYFFGSESEFELNAGSILVPDVYLVRKDRFAAMARRYGTLIGYPDLAVEVVSPNDNAADLDSKTEAYLRAGVHSVWVVYPKSRTLLVWRALNDVRRLAAGDVLEEPELLPGFRVPVENLFVNLPAAR